MSSARAWPDGRARRSKTPGVPGEPQVTGRARALPRRAQQLLGYGAHDALASGGGFLGAHELRDPLDALAAGRL
ncbi:hypothetical protein [Actinomadura sp. LOL_011]